VSSQPQRSEDESSATALPPEVETDQLPRALFGYERSAIVELLDTMSARVRELVQERADRERRIGELEQELERNREHQRLIGETLVKAREEAEAIREEARQSAEQDLESTRAEAERIREDARRSAEQDLQSTRAEAERIAAEAEQAATARVAAMIAAAQEQREALVEDARAERQAIIDEAGRARAFVDETHEQLSDFLMAAVRWYEQARPSAEREGQSGAQPDSASNDRSSMSSDLTAALTRESQSASSSSGRSEE
jgi:cell division septum initiation protein DivIVA